MGTICIYALFFIAAWGSIHGITGAVLKRKSEAYTGWGLLGLVSGILVMVFSCLQTGTVNTTYSLLATLFLLGSVSNMIAASLLQRTVLLYGYEQCNLKRIAADWLQARGRGEYHLFFGRHEEFRIPENHIRRLAYRSLSGGVPAPRLYFPSNGLRFFSGCLLVNRQQPVQDSGGLPFLVQGETAEFGAGNCNGEGTSHLCRV